ncbi:MAG TPA: DUF885 domain-containing protein [Candidatus Limnocylindrales bacterium]|nr:DUF885 domain-containing protein [Candidatus Limnocylindrales bacterium]
MPAIYDLADRYVERLSELDPVSATMRGIQGHDAEMTDYSPTGIEAREELTRSTLATLGTLAPATDRERTAAGVMQERLQVAHDFDHAGEPYRALNIISSPLQGIRQVFDVMPTETAEHWQAVLSRMQRVPDALNGLRASLQEGLRRGVPAARRQALACAQQARVWSGGAPGTRPFFDTLVDRYDRSPVGDPAFSTRLQQAAAAAGAGYAETASYLKDVYAPHAVEKDAVGSERYALGVRQSLGMEIDVKQAYHWGWAELHRIETQMQAVADRIRPGEPLTQVIHLLETDPARAIEGVDAFRQWLQDLMDRTIAELNGVHFDIPEPIRRVEAMIAPPGGAAAMYYTGPSEDFSRPGRTWYPTLGRTRFPLWGEVSTAYHEGVPGHHLQVAQVRYLAGVLSRYQRTVAWCPGYGEGWALYAERLMKELGYLDNPDYELGMLRAQAFRATRVIIDIGMHLELRIPAEEENGGARWTPELGLAFGQVHSREPAEFMRSEIDRYLGWPAQAISYKLGEREILAIREELRARSGSAFDLKAFHSRLLGLGPMGLQQLRDELLA